jgi:hypothetical protein
VGQEKASRAIVVAEARRLARENDAGSRRSLRKIAAALAEKGMLAPSGKPYLPGSIVAMIGPPPLRART